jgi:hypothetical protein
MQESAFVGTVLEGRERRYTILNEWDLSKYVSESKLKELNTVLNDVLTVVEEGRVQDGKKPYNSYLIINTDEPYVNDMVDIMKQNGHWDKNDQQEKYFILDIDKSRLESFYTWWSADLQGYTRDLNAAGRYTKEEVKYFYDKGAVGVHVHIVPESEICKYKIMRAVFKSFESERRLTSMPR